LRKKDHHEPLAATPSCGGEACQESAHACSGSSKRSTHVERRTQGQAARYRLAHEIFAELKKVTWPTWENTLYLTVVVIIVSAIMGILLGGADAVFSWFVERLLF